MAEIDGGGLGSPRGARELMPQASARRQWLVREVLAEFEAWGYGRVETPLVEYYDVLARGLTEADRAGCVRFIEAGTGTVVALRADVTPQIARMAAGRFGGELAADGIHRFCYAADVVRQPAAVGEATEQHQIGVELIGDGDVWADVELIALCDAALGRVGLAAFSIDVAHGQLARTVIDGLGLPAARRALVHGRLARKDRGGLEAALLGSGVEPGHAADIASLCDRIGPPAIVARAQRELAECLPREIIGSLASLVDAVVAYDQELAARLVVDLGETRGFDYYSGARLRVWAPGVPRPVIRGGRYDGMLARYGAAQPATGFAIDLDALEQALGRPTAGLSADAVAHAIVVARDPRDHGPQGGREQAARVARHARAAGQRAWIERASDANAAQALAVAAGATRLTWITNGGAAPRVQTYAYEAGRWCDVDEGNETP